MLQDSTDELMTVRTHNVPLIHKYPAPGTPLPNKDHIIALFFLHAKPFCPGAIIMNTCGLSEPPGKVSEYLFSDVDFYSLVWLMAECVLG